MYCLAACPVVGSVVRPGCDRAVDSPVSTCARAEFSALSSRPSAICSVRKKPSTAITAAEITSVVPTTRNCSDRCQRCLTFATTRCSQRSRERMAIVSRCGSQLTNQRTHFLRRSAISQASRLSRWSPWSCCGTGTGAGRGRGRGAAVLARPGRRPRRC